MCGRFTSTSTLEHLAATYGVDEVRTDPLPARYNVAPSLPVYAVAARRRPAEGEQEVGKSEVGKGATRLLGTYRWGLVPSWAKDPSVGNRLINARAEGIATKPAFRKALQRRRCIIPADAFYEWQRRPPPSGEPKRASKLPWAIRRKDGEAMAFAGLWELWRDRDDPDGEPLRTCAIVTTEANEALAPIHDRMPVVLGHAQWDTWLDPTVEDPAVLTKLLCPAPAKWFEAFPVSTRVNKVDHDGPELLEPLPPPLQ
ncbi:MAG: SOS response-associated peptidase [Acidimicrobiales bacterium]